MKSAVKKIVSISLIPYVIWVIFFYKYHFIDGVNLLFHEAGHLILSFFGGVRELDYLVELFFFECLFLCLKGAMWLL